MSWAAVVGLAVEAGGCRSRCGGPAPAFAAIRVGAGVVIETRRLQRIIAIDAEARTATVQPGVILADLNAARGGPIGCASDPIPLRPTVAARWAA